MISIIDMGKIVTWRKGLDFILGQLSCLIPSSQLIGLKSNLIKLQSQ